MKKKVLSLVLLLALAFSLTACNGLNGEANSTAESSTTPNSEEVVLAENNTSEPETSDSTKTSAGVESAEIPETMEEPTAMEETASTEESASIGESTQAQAPHEHTYIKEVVQEATCNFVGTTRYTCECGDTYDELVNMLSHIYGEFVYNNDATYEKDGTESTTCTLCGAPFTRKKEGSMLATSNPAEVPSESETVQAAQETMKGTTPETTVESMPESTPESGTDENHEHSYTLILSQDPTCFYEGFNVYSCECGHMYRDEFPKTAHTLGAYTYNNNEEYMRNGTETATCSVCKMRVTRVKEGTMIVDPALAPPGLDITIGNDLAFDGTVTSHNGVTLSKLASFNHAGLYNPPEEYVSNFEWSGFITNDINTPQGQAASTWGDGLYQIEQAVGCLQGYTIWNDVIYFYFLTGGSINGGLELNRYLDEGYYTIEINYDIEQGFASVTKEDGRDVLLGFCSLISSTPLELEAALYRDCFEEGFIGSDSYTVVGDCQVMFDLNNSSHNHYEYRIKPR